MFRPEHYAANSLAESEMRLVFRPEHYRGFARAEPRVKALDFFSQCSARNINRALKMFRAEHWDAFCTQILLVHNSSTLLSKCEPNYSANSSGSSTIYGTRYRCCQSEGRRG